MFYVIYVRYGHFEHSMYVSHIRIMDMLQLEREQMDSCLLYGH